MIDIEKDVFDAYPQHFQKFAKECDAKDMDVRHYNGRFYFSGPAVFTNEEGFPTKQDVIRATSMKVQWDNMAFDWVVYPKD